jgi:MFS family permease
LKRQTSGRWSPGELPALVTQGIGQFAIGIARVAAPYKAIELGASAFGIGLVGAAFGVLAVAIAVPTGVFADRVGERWILVGGTSLVAVAPIIQSSAGGLIALMVGQAVLGLGQTTLAIGTQARVARSIGSLSGDERFARMSISAAVANMAAPALAGAVIASQGLALVGSGLNTAFVIATVCGGLGVLVILPFSRLDTGPHLRRTEATNGKLRNLLQDPSLRRALLTSLGVLATIDVMINYLPLIGEERGIGPGFIGILLGLRSGAALVSRLALPSMLRHSSRDNVLKWMLLLSAGSAALLALDTPEFIMVIIVVVMGFGIGVGQPLTMSWTAERAGSQAGSALAMRMTSNRTGQLVVPTLLGALGATVGTGSIFVVVGIGLGASSWLVAGSIRS